MRALLVSLLFAAACTGTLEPLSQNGPGPGPGGPDAAPGSCDTIVATTVDGHHNPGQSCAMCHDGSAAPAFTVGGTLYADLAGSQPMAGASVHVIDAMGQEQVLETALNGNFWSTAPLMPPITTKASGCPNDIEMVTSVTAPATCNSGGCHGAGNRIHLP